jgi:hypothetical protein
MVKSSGKYGGNAKLGSVQILDVRQQLLLPPENVEIGD